MQRTFDRWPEDVLMPLKNRLFDTSVYLFDLHKTMCR